MDGWVKIHRKIKDNWLWRKPEYLKAWLDLIFRANYTDTKILYNGEFVSIKRGQLITSVRKLAEEWDWSKDKVLNFLRLLEKDEMIHRSSDRKRTLITIENYGFYQVCQDTDSYTNQDTNQDTNSPQKRKKEEKNNNSISNDDKKEQEEQFKKDFQILYDKYRKKRGRTDAFRRYKAWVTKGRKVNGKIVKLTNRQIWDAIKKYNEQQEGKDLDYYKNFDTFMGNSLLDFIDEQE